MSGERRDELARQGLEHLQAAAREVIQATRSLLDAAEELVEDPSAVQSLVTSLATIAQAAAGRLRAEAGGDPPDEGSHVERIRVS